MRMTSSRRLRAFIAVALVACASACAPASPAETPATQESPASPTVEPSTLPPLSLSPEKGIVGSSFTAALKGLTPGTTVTFAWGTWDGAYETTPTPETVQYEQRTFSPKRVALGQATADERGVAQLTVETPEDFGEVHDVFAAIDGKDVARSGYRVELSASISPAEGPVGTPITIKVLGMGAMTYSGSTLALRYDNGYTGILTATTTQGTAVAHIRAAGAVGRHYIVLDAGTVPAYLNIQQSPYDYVYSHLPDQQSAQFTFDVTGDDGPPAASVDWPDPGRVESLGLTAVRTTASTPPQTSVHGSLDVAEGPIRSRPKLSLTGLTPNVPVTAYWVTARGNRVTPSGWALEDVSLFTLPPAPDGTLSAPIEVPDDLGGWHMIKLVQAGQLVAQVPYYVDRSLESISAQRVKAGESVTIDLKGLGWTELDNGFAMTYDNVFAGYACGFNSEGDVTLRVLATGLPGTHLIDLYPMVYAGKDKKDWYWTPVLTYGEDFPALSLGYRLPAFRIAIEITK